MLKCVGEYNMKNVIWHNLKERNKDQRLDELIFHPQLAKVSRWSKKASQEYKIVKYRESEDHNATGWKKELGELAFLKASWLVQTNERLTYFTIIFFILYDKTPTHPESYLNANERTCEKRRLTEFGDEF